MALQRSVCTESARVARMARALCRKNVGGEAIRIDGFNIIVTLEVALAGGVVLVGRDGALRDLAGMRGSYHLVHETDGAIDLLGKSLHALGATRCQILLDSPMSNSGRLAARLREHAEDWDIPTQVELSPNPDKALCAMSHVVSSDSEVLDACVSWVNLAAWIVADALPDAFVVRLSEG